MSLKQLAIVSGIELILAMFVLVAAGAQFPSIWPVVAMAIVIGTANVYILGKADAD